MKILYISRTRLNYSLNAVLIRGLKENGVEVAEEYIKNKRLSGLFRVLSFYNRNKANADFIIVGYDSATLVPFLRIFCRKKIIFNSVLPLYDRMIVSRKLAPKISLKAAYYWLSDFLAVHLADLILAESERQAINIHKLFKVPVSRICLSYIGVDKNSFFHTPSVEKFETFTVLFRGQFLPESGVEYVVKAAKILENKGINFIIHGGGFNSDKIRRFAQELNPRNLKLITEFLPVEELRNIMQKCHLSLGQLSDHPRLERTIPHKAYESLSMRLPYLTAANAGVFELLKEGETCIACKSADAGSLAGKILWAKNNPQELERISQNGYQLYQDKLRTDVLIRKLLNKIEEL